MSIKIPLYKIVREKGAEPATPPTVIGYEGDLPSKWDIEIYFTINNVGSLSTKK